MQDPYLLLWLVLGAFGSLVGGYLFAGMGARMRRRARRERHRLAAQLREELDPPAPAARGITPERIAFISRDAQAAAWRVARGGQAAGPNPHPANTREFVLWEATFHSAMSDFSELAPDAQPAELPAPAPAALSQPGAWR